jgi:putative ABC transport system substrate-binding protein
LTAEVQVTAQAAELAALPVDVIFALGTLAASAARQATTSVPIVFAAASDPVGLGLVASLAHPGGNVTGASTSNAVLAGKRMEPLKESFPRVSRLGVLFNSQDPSNRVRTAQGTEAADALHVALVPLDLAGGESTEAVLARGQRDGVDALIVLASPLMTPAAAPIARYAADHRLPTIGADRGFVVAGGLMSYAASSPAQFGKAATYVDKILRGTRPTDLPVEQPTVFEFVVDLKLARVLDFDPPQYILLQAIEIIQ